MFRKSFFILLMLIGILVLATCGQRPASPSSQSNMPNMANPASVYCEQKGGKLDLRQDASGGVAGICVFPDGSECDEWAYYRGECKPGDSSATAAPKVPDVSLRVVYFKAGQIMSWSEGGSPQALVNADTEQVRISEDGQRVAFLGTASNGGYGLYSVYADGRNLRLLVGQNALQNTQPASRVVAFDFAPDSHTVYFVTDQYDLQRVDDATGRSAQVFGPGKGGVFSFSPDGQWMTLYHPNELLLAHPDGSSERLAFQFPPDFSSTMGTEIVWETDSSGFSMVSASGPQGEPDSMTVWSIPVTGDPARQMSYAGPYGANLSPDGRSVVYLYFQHEPVDVHIVAPDGKDSVYASYDSKTYPGIQFLGWAPDSQSFLLNLSKDGRMMDPYLCAAGKSPVKLTDTKYADAIAWVDAERMLFVSDGSLRLQKTGEASVALDAVSSDSFDFTVVKH